MAILCAACTGSASLDPTSVLSWEHLPLRGLSVRGQCALGPHHPVQLVLQLLVDPLQCHVVALNPAAGGNRVMTCKA